MAAFRFDVNSGETREVFKNVPIHNWSLSPDGNLIAIVGTDPKRSAIQLHSTKAGQAKGLSVADRGALTNIDWAADGKALLVTVADGAGRLSLLRVDLDGYVTELLENTDSGIIAAIPSYEHEVLEAAREKLPTLKVQHVDVIKPTPPTGDTVPS